jgi:hypothetical protein
MFDLIVPFAKPSRLPLHPRFRYCYITVTTFIKSCGKYSPLMLLTALLMKLGSHGRILFFQTRNGFNGRAPTAMRPAMTVSNVQAVAARGGRLILVTDAEGAKAAAGQPLMTLILPTMPSTIAPLVYAIPVQLIAYHTAVIVGTDVDQPRNLAKSVTAE